MSNFLLVGKNLPRLCDYLNEHNHDYVTLLDANVINLDTTRRSVVCDFSSIEKVVKAAEEINADFKIDGLVVVYENYILETAHIAQRLGLPGLPIDVAEVCSDKEKMRRRFATAPEKISPDFCLVKDVDDLNDFADTHKFPLMLKPTNLVKSLLVTKADNKDELLKQYAHTSEHIKDVYAKYAPHRQPKLLVEEFIEGSIHSVDAFVDDKGVVQVLNEVVDYETGQDIGFDDNFHYSRLLPSRLGAKDVSAIRHVAKIGCETLGIRSSPAHIEIILSPDGPRIVEIGARNGGYRERMYGAANGIDIFANLLAVITGGQPSLKASRNDPCVVLELFPRNGGIFKGISNLETLNNLESLAYFNQKNQPGDLVGKSADGYKFCAVMMLHNKDTARFNSDYQYVRNNVEVVTQ